LAHRAPDFVAKAAAWARRSLLTLGIPVARTLIKNTILTIRLHFAAFLRAKKTLAAMSREGSIK
jgi:predicted metal-dependent HD superfamily phosphohydrolase